MQKTGTTGTTGKSGQIFINISLDKSSMAKKETDLSSKNRNRENFEVRLKKKEQKSDLQRVSSTPKYIAGENKGGDLRRKISFCREKFTVKKLNIHLTAEIVA